MLLNRFAEIGREQVANVGGEIGFRYGRQNHDGRSYPADRQLPHQTGAIELRHHVIGEDEVWIMLDRLLERPLRR